MKRIFAACTCLVTVITVQGQSFDDLYSYGMDEYIEKCTDLPVVRKINGGTVFRVTYEGNWTNDMKGAFEYACKIWEEQLPQALPLNITAKIGTIRGGGGQKLLSKVNYTEYLNSLSALSSQIKAVVLDEYQRGNSVQFVDSIKGSDFFDKADISITYNEDLLDEFSYSLYATPLDKYDFVTVALRDIAKGLGISSRIMADVANKKIIYTGGGTSPYEEWIYSAIGGGNASQAYVNATKGSLPVKIDRYGTLSLYAPSPFQNGVSLNAFIPDPNKNITQLLTYEFGRGTVIRDITDNYQSLFKYGLGWEAAIATGDAHSDANGVTTGNTGEAIPYGGTITGGTPNFLTEANSINKQQSWNIETYNTSDFNIEEYCWPYDCNYRPNAPIDTEGWTVALLKKDGTWDIVYDISVIPSYLDVSMNDFQYHYDMNEYARTADGFLRCRVVYNQNYWDNIYDRTYRSMKTRYYVLNYLPQRTEMKFSGVMPTTSTRALTNEYMRDIKIGIKNLEGTERIVVEQLDEGERVPSKFEVNDFKKGYFVATVDKEFYSEFTIVAYNKNGSTRSETIEIAPLEPASQNFEIQVLNDEIKIKNARKRNLPKTLLASYEILPLNNYVSRSLLKGNIESNEPSINISLLRAGTYVLNYYDTRNIKHSVKFQKQ
ncbi:hypothetical protein [Paraprevotella clara]|uniref:hypothetical protein n=1 Tax=Paraprevotella clara TaxID=454154 RepID=UPI0026750F2A|nr:hypothetical protein [Paraprevotella clara]